MQMEGDHVLAFAGMKPPIYGSRLEWFNLFSDAEGLMQNPAPEVPDLPMPEIAVAGGGNGDTQGYPSPPSDLYEPLRREGRKERLRRRQDGDEEVGGYVEPEL
jgi:hypothetical protein